VIRGIFTSIFISFLDTDELPSLENTLIIIDEAHKLINPSKEDRIYAHQTPPPPLTAACFIKYFLYSLS
jgi:superfamily II DNA or RNA helicase